MKKQIIYIFYVLCIFIPKTDAIASSKDFESCVKNHYINIIDLLVESKSKDDKFFSKSDVFYLNYILYKNKDLRTINEYFYFKDKNYTICGLKFSSIGSRTPMTDNDFLIAWNTYSELVESRKVSNFKINQFLLEADRLGSAEAKAEIAVNRITGKTELKNISGALDKALESAKLGSSYGQYIVGGLYADLGWFDADGKYSTKGISEDLVLAYMWLNIAASEKAFELNLSSMDISKQATDARDEISKKMTASDITKAQKLSAKCMQSNYKDCQKSWW